MNRQIKFGMAAAVLMLLLSAGIASAIPAVPADYSGNVTINGTPAPDGTKVFVQVNKTTGYVYQTIATSVASGKYSNLMVNEENILEVADYGMPVRFYIQKPGESSACQASETTPFSSGPHTQDLTLVIPPCVAPLTPSTGPTPTATATATTPAPTATTTSPPSSGSGGSTGGGGVISAEPFDNVFKSEKRDGTLTANMPVTFSFTTPELAIYQVVITGKESENDVSVKIESLKGTSKLVTASPTGNVHKNINIWSGCRRVKEALIRFRVDNSWISGSEGGSGDIKLLKWDGTGWVQLETAEIRKDADYTHYEAKCTSFSPFAISSVKGITVPTATPEITATAPGQTPSLTPKPAVRPSTTWAYILVLIVIIAAVTYLYAATRKKGKK